MYGSLDALLRAFGDDVGVVCFQETKLGDGDVAKAAADGWDGAHSICRAKGKSGYAGVAVYWRSDEVCPLGIEEVCGTRMRKNETSTMWPGETPPMATNKRRGEELDDEGRALWVDLDAFVLCTVYVPAVFGDPAKEDKTADRAAFKADFLRARGAMRESRGDEDARRGVRRLEHRAVVEARSRARKVSAWASNLETHRASGWRACSTTTAADFETRLRAHPKAFDAYTCWNIASGAQLHNYGSRIDYFLCDREISMTHVERVGVAQHFEGGPRARCFLIEIADVATTATGPNAAVARRIRALSGTSDFVTRRVRRERTSPLVHGRVDARVLERASRPARRAASNKRKAPEPTMKDFFAVREATPNPNREPPKTTQAPIARATTAAAKSHAVEEWTRAFAKMAPPRSRRRRLQGAGGAKARQPQLRSRLLLLSTTGGSARQSIVRLRFLRVERSSLT